MVNYECIRCGYTTKDKTKMKSHFSRKTICKPLKNDINLDDFKTDILNGKSINLRDAKLMTAHFDSKMTQNDSIERKMVFNSNKKYSFNQKNDSKLTQNDSIERKRDSKMTQNDSKIRKKRENICKYCEKSFSRRNNLNRHLKTFLALSSALNAAVLVMILVSVTV